MSGVGRAEAEEAAAVYVGGGSCWEGCNLDFFRGGVRRGMREGLLKSYGVLSDGFFRTMGELQDTVS